MSHACAYMLSWWGKSLLDLVFKFLGQTLMEVAENNHCSFNISQANKAAFILIEIGIHTTTEWNNYMKLTQTYWSWSHIQLGAKEYFNDNFLFSMLHVWRCNAEENNLHLYWQVQNSFHNYVEGCSAKNHKTKCRDGNMQAGHIMHRLHKQPQPFIHDIILWAML